jgi:hypothetical protein
MTVTTLSAAPSKPWMPLAVRILVVPIICLGVGTGGAATLNYVKERGAKGYPYAIYDSSQKAVDVIASQTPAENLEHIRAVLRPTVTDLASVLGVSRQAIYDWQSGKAIGESDSSGKRFAPFEPCTRGGCLRGRGLDRDFPSSAPSDQKRQKLLRAGAGGQFCR